HAIVAVRTIPSSVGKTAEHGKCFAPCLSSFSPRLEYPFLTLEERTPQRSSCMGQATPSLRARCLAEVLGTFLLVFFGCGAVHTAVLTDAHKGLWQVAMVWGVAIMVAIYVVGGISGAHINPAITTALAAWGRVPRSLVLPYVGSQLIGAFLAAAALYALYHPHLADKEKDSKVTRGEAGSEITAMC